MPRADCSDRIATADVVWGASVRKRERGFAAQLERRIMGRVREAVRGADGSPNRAALIGAAVEAVRSAGADVGEEMLLSARAEERHLRRSMERIAETRWTRVPDDLLALVGGAERLEGLNVRQWADRIADTLGVDLRQALNRVEGASTTKAIRAARNGLRFLAATFVYRATAYARELSWQINRDRLRGVVWVSVLDDRTTPHVCIPRAWKRYRLPDFRPIGHDRPWLQGPGRSHPRCRARAVLVPAGCPWPRSRSGEKWLREQSHAVQEEVLGVRRATLWRSKRYTLNQMIEGDHSELRTLDELDDAGRRAVDLALR